MQNRTVKPPCSLRRRPTVSPSSSSPSKAKNLLLVRLWVFPSQRAPPIPHNHLCKAKLLNRQIKMSVIATVFQISFPSLGQVGQESTTFWIISEHHFLWSFWRGLRVDLSVSLRRHLEDSLATFLACKSVVIRGCRQCQVRLLMWLYFGRSNGTNQQLVKIRKTRRKANYVIMIKSCNLLSMRVVIVCLSLSISSCFKPHFFTTILMTFFIEFQICKFELTQPIPFGIHLSISTNKQILTPSIRITIK